jgi:hypothetical protein
MVDTSTSGVFQRHDVADAARGGVYALANLGIGARSLAQGTEIKPDETFSPFRHHTEKKALTRP